MELSEKGKQKLLAALRSRLHRRLDVGLSELEDEHFCIHDSVDFQLSVKIIIGHSEDPDNPQIHFLSDTLGTSGSH